MTADLDFPFFQMNNGKKLIYKVAVTLKKLPYFVYRVFSDAASADRYHCSHSAGVHSVVIPWVYRFEQYVRNGEYRIN